MAFNLETAYHHCKQLACTHYENFPVASLLLPKKIRKPISVIYAFARTADDIVDEGSLSTETRLQNLNAYWDALERTIQNLPPQNHPVFIALQDVIRTHSLPTEHLFDLLRAFKQDINPFVYPDFESVLSYCRYSANPIGRLLLHLTHQATPLNCVYSDAVCTSLQLINFLQDLSCDLTIRNRCYFPQDELTQFKITRQDLHDKKINPTICKFIQTQIARARSWMQEGSKLGAELKGLFGLEIRSIIQGGLYIIQALEQRKNPYARPTLKKRHIPLLLWKALRK